MLDKKLIREMLMFTLPVYILAVAALLITDSMKCGALFGGAGAVVSVLVAAFKTHDDKESSIYWGYILLFCATGCFVLLNAANHIVFNDVNYSLKMIGAFVMLQLFYALLLDMDRTEADRKDTEDNEQAENKEPTYHGALSTVNVCLLLLFLYKIVFCFIVKFTGVFVGLYEFFGRNTNLCEYFLMDIAGGSLVGFGLYKIADKCSFEPDKELYMGLSIPLIFMPYKFFTLIPMFFYFLFFPMGI